MAEAACRWRCAVGVADSTGAALAEVSAEGAALASGAALAVAVAVAVVAAAVAVSAAVGALVFAPPLADAVPPNIVSAT